MWLMLNAEQPADYVIGTGATHTVREFCEIAFARVGLDYREFVEVDPDLARPVEKHQLRADPEKARDCLGWKPEVSFAALVQMMVDADVERLS
jgi:GDPmannose 4,6-dehydratase